MRAERTPQEKKILAKNRAAMFYGEAPHATHKSIPLRKKLRNRANRHDQESKLSSEPIQFDADQDEIESSVVRQSSAALGQLSGRPAGRRHRQKTVAESDAAVHSHP
jgi:hypothetical protein